MLSNRAAVLVALAAAVVTSACGADRLVAIKAGDFDAHVGARVGDRIEVMLQSIGPGEYTSPPDISSPAVQFLDVVDCGNPIPAGVTQCFHFRAVESGSAVLTFTHTGMNRSVRDTIDVR